VIGFECDRPTIGEDLFVSAIELAETEAERILNVGTVLDSQRRAVCIDSILELSERLTRRTDVDVCFGPIPGRSFAAFRDALSAS
jgi:hypothetical protein